MNPEYHEQGLRLQQYRRSLAEQNNLPGVANFGGRNGAVAGEENDHELQYEVGVKKTFLGTSIESQPVNDPMMYPGLYAPSGVDMMGILVRIRTRSNPVIDIGNIDSSVALVLCDTAAPDTPIVYCSEPFETLTGYSSTEILGRNCRFLQRPYHSLLAQGVPRETMQLADQANAKPLTELREKLRKGEEAQVRLVNYTKSGKQFFNLLTTIPIKWDEGDGALGREKRYIVGFQAQDLQR